YDIEKEKEIINKIEDMKTKNKKKEIIYCESCGKPIEDPFGGFHSVDDFGEHHWHDDCFQKARGISDDVDMKRLEAQHPTLKLMNKLKKINKILIGIILFGLILTVLKIILFLY
ncbi:hypothetical protein KY314_03230, partial [Candidatus Woesearchaeota archaeon]|nr:hypothetical protein [Candidatus Woesearchaeota archaeon]